MKEHQRKVPQCIYLFNLQHFHINRKTYWQLTSSESAYEEGPQGNNLHDGFVDERTLMAYKDSNYLQVESFKQNESLLFSISYNSIITQNGKF